MKRVRPTRWLRRFALGSLLLGLVVAAVGWSALGAAGESRGRPAKRQAAEPPGKPKLPPLPKRMRPKVVTPVAGESETEAEPAPAVEREPAAGKDAAPTRAASGAVRRPRGVLAGTSPGVEKAVALDNGVALPPLEAPAAVKQIIEAGNAIARTPYKWGGGHGRWLDTGYDCSGSVSFALAAAGLLNGPLASGPLMSWGKPGRGKWVTIYTNPGHVYLEVAGIRFDTSGAREKGSRWQNELRSHAGYVARHPPGL
jgi:cell wall-associated NlpC family hydrolase